MIAVKRRFGGHEAASTPTPGAQSATLSPARELLLILLVALGVFVVSTRFDILQAIVDFAGRHQKWEIDDFVVTGLFLMLAFGLFALRRSRETIRTMKELAQYARELQATTNEVRQLQGIIPICASCKKIRDDKGFWHQVERYISDHSEADFSHSLCPDCIAKLYPELLEEEPAGGSDSGNSPSP